MHPCWTLENAREIMKLAKPGARVLQLGAGFIGCIIMEALAMRGVQLTVVEMGDRMVPRMMGPTAGTMIKQWVEAKGVKVHTGARAEAIEREAEPGLLGKVAAAIGLGAPASSAPMRVRLSMLAWLGSKASPAAAVSACAWGRAGRRWNAAPYLILVSLYATCLRTTGSYFFTSIFSG